MLTSQVIYLKHLYGLPENISGKHLHGFFFKKILGTMNPKFAADIHEQVESKPFSLSYLYPWNNMYWFRIATWDERIPETVFAYFNETQEFEFNRCGFQLIKTTTHPADSYWANRLSIQSFIEQHFVEMDRFRLIHKGATSFKTGDAHIPLPVPELIVNSIYRKLPSWLKDVIQDISKEQIIETIRLKGHRIESIYNKKTYGAITSFAGETRWQIDQRTLIDTRKAINLMFNFAFYCGIGVKTTQGMGMCRIVY
jgi:CRISPR-associated endoribonuclease Cas6